MNEVANVVEAFASAGAAAKAVGDVALDASDTSTLGSISGQGGGAGGAALGAAASYNSIGNHVRAYADAATLESTAGSVVFDATENPVILTLAASGNGAGFFALAGGRRQRPPNTVEAYVANGSNVTADHNVLVLATFDGSNPFSTPDSVDPGDGSAVASLVNGLGLDGINAIAGAAGGAFVGVGGAVVVNLVSDVTLAYVADSTVVAQGERRGGERRQLRPGAR